MEIFSGTDLPHRSDDIWHLFIIAKEFLLMFTSWVLQAQLSKHFSQAVSHSASWLMSKSENSTRVVIAHSSRAYCSQRSTHVCRGRANVCNFHLRRRHSTSNGKSPTDFLCPRSQFSLSSWSCHLAAVRVRFKPIKCVWWKAVPALFALVLHFTNNSILINLAEKKNSPTTSSRMENHHHYRKRFGGLLITLFKLECFRFSYKLHRLLCFYPKIKIHRLGRFYCGSREKLKILTECSRFSTRVEALNWILSFNCECACSLLC